MRPSAWHTPADWYVVPLMIFRRVVFPEPLMPMSPSVPPGSTSTLTSFSTQR